MSTFVIDASVAIKWVVEEPGTQEALLFRRHRLLAPDLLMAECADVLWKKVRRKELTRDLAMIAPRLLAGANVEIEPMRGLLESTGRLSITLGHRAYFDHARPSGL
ncbi:MAG: type II toxin-antitoxin system VapC family toxin [Rhodopila sp.]